MLFFVAVFFFLRGLIVFGFGCLPKVVEWEYRVYDAKADLKAEALAEVRARDAAKVAAARAQANTEAEAETKAQEQVRRVD